MKCLPLLGESLVAAGKVTGMLGILLLLFLVAVVADAPLGVLNHP